MQPSVLKQIKLFYRGQSQGNLKSSGRYTFQNEGVAAATLNWPGENTDVDDADICIACLCYNNHDDLQTRF